MQTLTKLGNKIELIGEGKVLIIGVFHGDEPQGKFLIEEYLKKHPSPQPSPSRGEGVDTYSQFTLKQAKEHIKDSLALGGRGLGRGGILFIPCLNPDGMQLGTRCNANGVDLNRNFPTKNWGEDTSLAGDNPADYFGGKAPASEIETQFVIDVIEKYKPELIITLHAPYKVVNYDGPAQKIAEKISEIIKYPVEASIGYPTPGSFGTYAGVERQIPTITLELDETCPIEDLIKPVYAIFELV